MFTNFYQIQFVRQMVMILTHLVSVSFKFGRCKRYGKWRSIPINALVLDKIWLMQDDAKINTDHGTKKSQQEKHRRDSEFFLWADLKENILNILCRS